MIDKQDLYKLPWTRENNPNGWVEPTTYCQLKCPFCFRGLDKDGAPRMHVPLATVKKEVEDLISLRRIGTVSIAGGEPLLYPHLDELIDFIRARNVEVLILTNGLRLDREMIIRLKERQVARVVVHIDKHQGREGIETEEDANRLRQTYCDLFREIGGISLGFIQPIGLEELDDLEVLLPFFKENSDVVDLVVFDRLQPTDYDAVSDDQILTGIALFERVKEIYGLEYGAYLEKTHSDEFSWLLGQAVFSGKHLLGSLDKQGFRFIQEEHHRRTGQYLHCTRNGHTSPGTLLRLLFNGSVRKMLARYFRLEEKGKTNLQLILAINTPKKLENGEYDRCDGCPNAMLYEGELVPSCLLELVKNGEQIRAG